MAGILGKVGIHIVGDTRSLVTAFATAKLHTKSFSGALVAVGPQLSKLGKSFLILGGAAAAGLGLMAKSAMSVERALIEATAVTPGLVKGTADFKTVMDMTREASIEFGRSQENLARIWFRLGSAGFDAATQMKVFNDVARFSFATSMDMEEAASAVVDVMSAYKLAAEDVGGVLDKLTMTELNANLTFQDLTQSLSYGAGVAAALNIPIEETLASLGVMANQGIKASRAGTTLRRVLLNLYAPTETMVDAMNSLGVAAYEDTDKSRELKNELRRLGDELDNLDVSTAEGKERAGELENQMRATASAIKAETGDTRTLSDVLSQIKVGLSGMSKEQGIAALKILGGARGVAGLIAVLGELDGKYAELIEATRNAGGAMDELASKIQSAAQEQMKQMKEAIRALTVSLGEELLPIISRTSTGIKNFAIALGESSPNLRHTLVSGLALATGLSLLTGAALKLAPGIHTLTLALHNFNLATKIGGLGIATYVGLIVGLLATLKIAIDSYKDLYAVRLEGQEITARAQSDEILFNKIHEVTDKWNKIKIDRLKEIGYLEGEEEGLKKDLIWAEKRLALEKEKGEDADKLTIETLTKLIAKLKEQKQGFDEASASANKSALATKKAGDAADKYAGSTDKAAESQDELDKKTSQTNKSLKEQSSASKKAEDAVTESNKAWEKLTSGQRKYLRDTLGGTEEAIEATDAYKEHGQSMIETMKEYGIPARKMLDVGRDIKRMGGIKRWAEVYAPERHEKILKEEEEKREKEKKKIREKRPVPTPIVTPEERKKWETPMEELYPGLYKGEKRTWGEIYGPATYGKKAWEQMTAPTKPTLEEVAKGKEEPLPEEMTAKALEFTKSIEELGGTTERVGDVIIATLEEGQSLIINLNHTMEHLQKRVDELKKTQAKLGGGGEAATTGNANRGKE